MGGWYSYRTSKAALNMVLKNLSIEWRRTMPRCSVAALHPGTTDTPLSAPFQRNVSAEKLFTPAQTAGYLLALIDQLTPKVSGRFWSWDGEILPW
jgi:NAD(P)-dependent dehydrogenase (short-subunit alcohol dehydrogenase family)